ncbi:MAG: LysR substrate-binding domain-containing protein [Kiloniellales bacterium]|nr:LysR substrate-binding domain-containing protein [Kiloniellales bacterium]
MRKGLPPLQWLRSFEAAARHMSFTLAAEELGITQSAVSQQVKSLETFLGQALFLRRPRSLALTEAGRSYLPTIREAFSILAEGTSAFVGPRPEKLVEIKSNPAFSVHWLAPRLGQFFDRYPDVQINLSTAMWDVDFTGGYGSIEIRFGRGEWGGDAGEKLSSIMLFPIASPELAEKINSPSDLADQTLFHISGGLHDWDYWFEAQGIPAVKGRTQHILNTYVMTFELARRGLGVAMAHSVLVEDLLQRGDLVRLFDGEVLAREAYYLVGPRHGETSAAAGLFCSWLRETLS